MTRKIWPVTLIFILLIAVYSTAYASQKIRVLNPTPPNRMVDRVPLIPRLDTLEGKTIFLVDIGWGGKDAAPSIFKEMKAWFARNMPGVKVEVRSVKGSYMMDQPELWKEISEKGDAAMVGISGWDSCTSAVSRNCKTLEQKYNIPAVGGAAANIINYARNHDFKYTNGSPIRYIAFPFPVAGQPQSVHHQYIFEGNDVVSGKPMMQAFIDALTAPLTEKEKYKGPAPEPQPAASRFLGPDTEENLHRLFKDNDWTDYLPIVLPTEERVAKMLEGTSHSPDKIIKILDWPGGKREVTVERVATCAVMAGAGPEHLPVILALANHVPFGNSTSSMANMILVNGPIRDEINMNYGTNVMGPHNEANAVIGRSYTIMSKTIGGLHSEKTTWSTLGSTMQYNNVCIAENEEALPEGWEPFHVQMGYKPEDNVITVGIGWSYISSVVMAVRDYPVNKWMGEYMKSLTMGSATVIMDPTVADLLRDSLGFETKDQLSKWFAENVEKIQYPSGQKVKPFRESSVKIIVTGGGVQTTWFVTDFMMGGGMIGGSTLIDEWR